MSVSLTDTNDPKMLEVDRLNSHNNQNANAGPQSQFNPLVRGLVRTNLSIPSFGVVSEMTNRTVGAPGFCSQTAGVCDSLYIGDPIQNNEGIQGIVP
jgi:hypothetical protein